MTHYYQVVPREFRRKRRPGDWIPPIPPKKCLVRWHGQAMNYNEMGKRLYFDHAGGYHIFPTTSAAKKAIYHTIHQDAKVHAADLIIEPVPQ